MKETASVRNQILWVLFLTLYPVASTLLMYYFILKDSGYAGMILFPLACFYLIICFICNIIATSASYKDYPYLKEQAWAYLFPILSPVVCGVILLKIETGI